MTDTFTKAEHFVRHGKGTVSTSLQLQFYGLYKQATQGPNTHPAPSLFKVRQYQKWAAWHKHGQLQPALAQERYVALLTAHAPNWQTA